MHIVSVNRAFTEMTGYAPTKSLGQAAHAERRRSGRRPIRHHDRPALRMPTHWQGEVLHRRKSGETYPAWLHVSVIRDAEGRPGHYIIGFLDISDRKQAEERIEYMAFHDPLTGLPNRRLAMERLELAIAWPTAPAAAPR
jgi:PAS domain S-box-containing protein